MRSVKFVSIIFGLLVMVGGEVQATIKTKELGNGWIGFTKQADPFDSSKIAIIQIVKGDFTFRCHELNMKADSYGYESLSFSADLKYVIDGDAPKSNKGKYSTYLGGSDLITDSRYYSFKMIKTDVDAMKSGTTMKVAGKYSSAGWQTKSVSLKGFTAAYDQMCD